MHRALISGTIAAVLVAVVAFFTVTASAGTVRPLTGCTQMFGGSVDQQNNTGEVHWITLGCGRYIAVKIGCDSRFMGGYTKDGGFVRSRIDSAASCRSGFLIVEVWARIKDTLSGSVSTCEEWPTQKCGSGRREFVVRNPPVCERVMVQENSGAGPNYPVELCGSAKLPVRFLVVDGATLPERNTSNARVVLWNP